MKGARWTKYHDAPAPLPRISITRSSGRPSARANAIASAATCIAPAQRIWLVAFVAWPAPLPPISTTVLPSASSRGFARSKVAASPPHMIASVAFLAPGLVAVGDTDSVKRGIDNTGGANITTNTELMDLVREIDDSNAWAVGRFDALVKHANLPEGVTSQIPAVKWFSASGHVNGGLSGLLRAEARDEQAGQNLRDVVQGFLALARLQAGSRPEIQAMVSSLQVSGSGRTVALSFSLPTEAIEALGAAAGAAKKSHEMHRERQHEADDR